MRFVTLFFKVLASTSFFLVLVEIGLRVVPTAIPTRVLMYFEPELRATAATGRFSTRRDVIELKRDDGGPILRIWKPFTRKPYDFQDYGAVQEVLADEKGFCNPPGSYEATPTIDILALGDSFTWCHAVLPEDGWPVLVGKLTGSSSYNLGKGGIGLYEEIQILKQFGLSRMPKIVVLNIYEGNDVRDAIAYHRSLGGKSELDDVPAQAWQSGFLGRKSYAYNFIRGGTGYLLERGNFKWASSDIDFRFRVGAGENTVLFNEGQGATDEVDCAKKIRAGEFHFNIFDRGLKEFVRLAQAHNFVPVIAYTPLVTTVYAPVDSLDPALSDLLSWFSKAQREYFAAKSQELGFTFIDLTPALQQAAASSEVTPKTLLYFPTTIHYTKLGHAVVAKALAAQIRQLPGLNFTS